MAITFRHDAAAVVPPSNQSTRKYGQSLVLQNQQQKYASQQAAMDRMFNAGMQQQQNQFQLARDKQQNAFVLDRGKQAFVQQQQLQEDQTRQAFMDEARKMQSGMIMDDIKNGEYDPATSRKLQDNLVKEAEALGNPQLDATQRAEALDKIRAERVLLSANRLQKPPPPTAQEQFDQGVVVDPETGMRYRQNSKGDYEPLAEKPQPEPQPQQPTSFGEYAQQDPEKARAALASKIAEIEKGVADETITLGKGQTAEDLAIQQLEQPFQIMRDRYGPPTAAPALPGGEPAAPGEMKSILEQAPPNSMNPSSANPWLRGSQQASPMTGGSQSNPWLRERSAPSPEMLSQTPTNATNPSSANPWLRESSAPAPVQAPRKVDVGGKPLAVTPGTLTPQETEARNAFMQLPREQRIAALMPYDPELKGKSLEQLLESPEIKSQYDALPKELKTGNYREDMLAQLDQMLQYNVMDGAGQAPPSAYVGMRADEVTDPKAKAEIDKMPRPKSKADREMIRSGQSYVDPEGVIRVRA